MSLSSTLGISAGNPAINISQVFKSYTPRVADTTQLAYNQNASVSQVASPKDNLQWSFASSNSYVKITVLAMDSSDYSDFENGRQYVYQILSGGSKSADNGVFTPDYSDTWYIVFLNWDPINQSVTLMYSVTAAVSFNFLTFFYSNLGIILIAWFGVNVVIMAWMYRDMKHYPNINRIGWLLYAAMFGFIACILYLFGRGRRTDSPTKEKPVPKSAIVQLTPPPSPIPQGQPPSSVVVIQFCPVCGAPVNSGSKICESCGSEFP